MWQSNTPMHLRADEEMSVNDTSRSNGKKFHQKKRELFGHMTRGHSTHGSILCGGCFLHVVPSPHVSYLCLHCDRLIMQNVKKKIDKP